MKGNKSFILALCIAFFLTACKDKGWELKKIFDRTAVQASTVEDMAVKQNQPDNLEKLYAYCLEAANQSNFINNADFVAWILSFESSYKNDIVSPYDKSCVTFGYDNNSLSIRRQQAAILSKSQSFYIQVMDNQLVTLKDQQSQEFVYALNKNNKGKCIVFLFVDGCLLYSVDETGKKGRERSLFYDSRHPKS